MFYEKIIAIIFFLSFKGLELNLDWHWNLDSWLECHSVSFPHDVSCSNGVLIGQWARPTRHAPTPGRVTDRIRNQFDCQFISNSIYAH